jgi:hypothetical protein
MEELKPLDQIFKPDPRQELFVKVDRETGAITPITVEDLHANVEDIRLRDSVPESVRSQFNVARNLFVYSWFVYGFGPASELYAFGALENALKERGRQEGMAPDDRKCRVKGLKAWLHCAIKHNWVQDKPIKHYQRNLASREESQQSAEAMGFPVDKTGLKPGPQDYCKLLADTFPYLRNSMAHGHGMLWPPGTLTLELCADLINQLFPETN